MKKKKIAFLIIMMAVCTMLLCSCKALDIAREKQGFFLNEEKDEIGIRGWVYQQIRTGKEYLPPYAEVYDPDVKDFHFINYGTGDIYITEKNVPLLLRVSHGYPIGYYCGPEEEPIILCLNYYDDQHPGENSRYYCREDKVSEVETMLKELNFDHFYMQYGIWLEEKETYTEKTTVLDDSLTKILREAIDRDFREETDYKNLYDIPNISREFLEIHDCDKDALITSGKLYQIVRTGGLVPQFYIAVSDTGEGDERGVMANVEWRQIPEEDAIELEQFFVVQEDQIGNYGLYDENGEVMFPWE